MSFFGTLGKKLTQTGQDASQKVNEVKGTIKYNNLISDERRTIAEMYIRIGKAYCELHGDDPEEDLASFVASVKIAEDRIAEYQRQINLLKSLQECPGCGALVDIANAFCPKCGTKMPEVKVEPEPEPEPEAGARICAACGSEVEEGMLFCPVCGAIMEDETAEAPEAEEEGEGEFFEAAEDVAEYFSVETEDAAEDTADGEDIADAEDTAD